MTQWEKLFNIEKVLLKNLSTSCGTDRLNDEEAIERSARLSSAFIDLIRSLRSKGNRTSGYELKAQLSNSR